MIAVLNLFNIRPDRAEQYQTYLQQVKPLLARHGAKILFYGVTRMVCLGQLPQQYCGLVLYPDMAALRALSHDPDFKRIQGLRDASTSDFEMVVLDETPV